MTITESNATTTVMWLVGTATALVAYIGARVVVFPVGIPLLLGAALGGYTGAHLALRKGTAWVKIILAIVITVSAVKLLFL